MYTIAVKWAPPMWAPPVILYMAIQQSGISMSPSRLKSELSGGIHVQIASLMTNSLYDSCCRILMSSQQVGWSSCSAVTYLSVKPLMRVSFRQVSTLCIVLLMYTFLQVHRTLNTMFACFSRSEWRVGQTWTPTLMLKSLHSSLLIFLLTPVM